jgi:hypothetical protein
MMDLSPFILAGFALLPKVDATIGASTVEAVFNQSTHRDNKTFGGFEPDNEASLSIQTSLLTNPKSLKGGTITIDGEPWRVTVVRYGAAICHFTLVSPDKT